MQTDRYLTDADVAERLRMCRASVWALSSRGVIPRPVHFGRAARWRLSDLERAESALHAASDLATVG